LIEALYFTGQNSAAVVDTTGSGSFDLLRAQVGIFNPAGQCNWSGTLTDLSGVSISFASGSGVLAAGNNTINFDFNGNLIAQSGKSGPYLVKSVGVNCPGSEVLASPLFQTPAFTVSQFHSVPQSITISIDQSAQTILASATVNSNVSVASAGGFSGLILLAVSGLPTGITAGFSPDNTLSTFGGAGLTLSAASTVVPGLYPLTLTATSGALISSTPITLTIAQPDFSLAVSPS
jgi:hypothetical protein